MPTSSKAKEKQSDARFKKQKAELRKMGKENDRSLARLEKSNLAVRAAFVEFAITFGRPDWINSKTLPPRRF